MLLLISTVPRFLILPVWPVPDELVFLESTVVVALMSSKALEEEFSLLKKRFKISRSFTGGGPVTDKLKKRRQIFGENYF